MSTPAMHKRKSKPRLSLQLTGDGLSKEPLKEKPHRQSWLLHNAVHDSNVSVDSNATLADEYYMDPEDVVDSSLSFAEKKKKITLEFIRAASNGDVAKVRDLLVEYKKWIDIDAQDGEGTTALIYASCFGHADVVYLLLENNAKCDGKDKHGWTPLMWAVSNGHEEVARILIEGGANKEARSNRGRSVKDLVGRSRSLEMSRILDYEPTASEANYSDSEYGDAVSDTDTAVSGYFSRSVASSPSPIPGHRSHSALSHVSNLSVDELGLFDDDDQNIDFAWDKCLLDQMFVFNETETEHIIDVAISSLKPTKSNSQKPIPANVIFLCARYAHYFNSQEMLDSFLQAVIEKIVTVVQRSSADTNLVAYWIANCTQLLYYLKRDTGLVIATFETQCQISELIHEISILFVREVERRLINLLPDSILEHNPIEGLNNVRFENSLSVFLSPRRKSFLKPTTPTGSPSSPVFGLTPPAKKHTNNTSRSRTASGGWTPAQSTTRTNSLTTRIFSKKWPYKITPKTLTTTLTSTLAVLQSSLVHREIIHQIFLQLFHFFGSELFNRILTDAKYCSRSKAMQIRMNVSAIEDWVRQNRLEIPKSSTILAKLDPVIQLLQFLQVATSEKELSGFVDTLKSMDCLTYPQARRVMINYKFEVGEDGFGSDVEEYVHNTIESLKIVQSERLDMKQETSSKSRKRSKELLRQQSSLDLSLEEVQAELDEHDVLEELLDPTLLLPFQVPVVVGGNGDDSGVVGDDNWLGSTICPSIPEEVMKMLDRKSELVDTTAPIHKLMVDQPVLTVSPEPVTNTPQRRTASVVAGLKSFGRGIGAAVGAGLGVVDAAINAVTPVSPLPDNIPTPPWAFTTSPLSSGPSNAEVEAAARTRRGSVIERRGSLIIERRQSVFDRRGSISTIRPIKRSESPGVLEASVVSGNESDDSDSDV